MSNPERIEINGATYVLQGTQPPKGPLSLLVLHRGFIFVGEWDGETLTNASNVRKWSSGGFGGLTMGAKSSGATLDPCSDLTPMPEAIISVHGLRSGWSDA